MANAINWFELPSVDFKRAVDFYAQVFDAELQTVDMDGFRMGFFPAADGGVGGCVTHGNGNLPQEAGTLVYLNGGDDLSVPLARVSHAGGEVVMPKTSIGENGFMAVFKDTEGNRVAFHSMG
ncbi:MAG: VOC family protein [Saprospiraceae bacterium]|nr:VOC family protein [Lewinella sp.]